MCIGTGQQMLLVQLAVLQLQLEHGSGVEGRLWRGCLLERILCALSQMMGSYERVYDYCWGYNTILRFPDYKMGLTGSTL